MGGNPIADRFPGFEGKSEEVKMRQGDPTFKRGSVSGMSTVIGK